MKWLNTIKSIVVFMLTDLIAMLMHTYYNNRNIWIFSEKKTEARDNGYHFFKYIRENHPEIEAYYVITKDSSDRNRVLQIGPVIDYDSFKHCVYYFSAKERVCSQIHGVKPFEAIAGINKLRFYKRKDQHQINLKHGISKDFRPDSFDFRKVGFDLYVSGARPEYEYIKKTFSYPDKNIVLSGFCRFDVLQHVAQPQKIVLIMPTFRSWLRTSDSAKNQATPQEIKMFQSSVYFKSYYKLLNDKALRTLCCNAGYKIIFYLHYTFQPYYYVFEKNVDKDDNVIIANRKEYDVQDLLIRSSVLITDYSSVFFDYAYMHKPVIYYQFDKQEYREKHYQEGFFEYDRDGFGPVLTQNNEVVNYLEHVIDKDCKMDDVYLKRALDFFQPYDDHNCERVYDAILRLDK